jgi:beta-glucanase (GH16 family)
MLKISQQIAAALLLLGILSCGKGGDNGGGGGVTTLPAASIANISQERGISDQGYVFTVTLNKPATSEVSINYTTVAATALANTDFVPATGTLKIPANSSTGNVTVQVKGDSTRKEDQYFYLQLDNPVNCTLSSSRGTGSIINANGTYYVVDNKGYDAPTSYPGLNLAWSDEFSGRSVNTDTWAFEQGNNNGWGNAELEFYTDRTQNAFVSNGNLIIEARKEVFSGFQYTSARMITKNKKKFTYGRVDIRAKTPTTQGIWPALWMLGNNIDQVSWPACGEIDIMEQKGQESSRNYGTLHWGANTASHQFKGGNVVLAAGYDKEFHVYSVIWKTDTIQFLVDNVQYFEVPFSQISGNNPFTLDHFFIFNVAVGGNFLGSPDNTTVLPQRMVVDYIRIYQ